MADLDLDSKTILDGLAHLDRHDHLPPNVAEALSGLKLPPNGLKADTTLSEPHTSTTVPHAPPRDLSFGSSGPNAIATLKVETGAVLKELTRFRACDDQTMSCFYCREWAQWVYRKQISQGAVIGPMAVSTVGSASRKKKNRVQSTVVASVVSEDVERERMERRRAARARFSTVGDLCLDLRSLVGEEREQQEAEASETPVSRPESPAPSVSSATSASAPTSAKPKDAVDKAGSALIDGIVDNVTLWFEGYQFPLADVYEDLTFDFPPDAFPYDDNQDPLDPALLLPALQVTKGFIALPAPSFPLLGNITSELIATHTYPTCQHTKADHPTPSELDTQRLIFNSQLQKWRGEYKRSFEREMEPVWQITQLLLKSAQRIETMRVRLFARGCRANREQFLQTIRNRTRPFAEYWAQVSEVYRTGKTDDVSDDAGKKGRGKRAAPGPAKAKTGEQLAEELDTLVFTHLDNLLEVSASWSRTFLESYYGVAREFARELETILGECITMCDRRAQGLKYPPPLSLEPQLTQARTAIACLQPQLEGRIGRIQQVVRERNGEIFAATEELRTAWVETSGATVQTKMARAAHKDFKKRMRRIEYQQQTGVIGWAMRELEHLLTAADVAAVVTDCLELLMTEAEILERAVGQVFVRKLEPTTEDLREQRQDIIDDFTEGLLTGREELAGIVGKLMLKEAWRILESNISLQRQKLLLDNGRSGKGKKKASVHNAVHSPVAPVAPAEAVHAELEDDDEGDGAGKKRKKNKKNKKKKGKKGAKQVVRAAHEDDEDDDDDVHEDVEGDSQNPFATLTWADGSGQSVAQKSLGLEEPVSTVSSVDAVSAIDAVDAEAEISSAEPVPAINTDVGLDSLEPVPAIDTETLSTKGSDAGLTEEGRTRSRRGTNAARYVPGVGFVSDDGVSATSPQLLTSSATFKAGLRGPAAAVAKSNSGRMSPMGAARLVTSRPASSLSNNGSSSGVLDREQLAGVQNMLLAGPPEAMERVISGLGHENAVALAVSALNERRRQSDEAAGWHASVSRVLQTYDAISSQLDAFRNVCESHETETARLSAQLAQASQNAQEWQERHARVSEELARLKAGESKDTWSQQRYPSFGGAQFGFQYPGFMSNASYASAPMMFASPNGQPMGTEAEASSASLLTALNAGSQPF
ncbi:hypothetical protein GGH12_005142 [Coemansia sp. RSA 1822]|nr:hypothetical protein IW147_004319 [Coemansia sp. RSA 720]KAJ2542556.1 hypothetical protein GGF49_002768 [Coemansia sp. RSA 1853]KAJ2560061.1 hypothetical protein GGH12_005142 [Coemansia sp. RSA 1822]